MGAWFRKLVSARAANAAARSKFKFIGPERLIIACAVVLSVIVVGSASLIVFNLRNQTLSENERTLANSALILAKQIEQTFATVEAVQRGFNDELSHPSSTDNKTIESQLARHDVHTKLKHEAAGMPYVASLTIFNADGRVINTSRQWPAPDVTIDDRDYFEQIKLNSTLTSFLGGPVRSRASGAMVIHLARRISGLNGEFLGIIAAALDVQYLQNYFGEISAESNSGVALFRNDGVLLARFPSNSLEIGRQYPTAVALKLVANSDHGVGVSAGVIDGSVRMVAAHRINNYPMVVTATRTTAVILADWRKTAAFIAGASLLTIVSIIAFAVLFMRLFWNYQALLQARNERDRAEQLREQSLRFDVALNNMSQGLVNVRRSVEDRRLQFAIH
jgi:hypothetical protein